jgi:hypothetical protein
MNKDINEEDLVLDSDDERNTAQIKQDDLTRDIVLQEPTNDRKQQLKMKLLNESQNYYQNNMN